MRYLGLLLFTSAVWALISVAGAAQQSLAAAREGREAGGVSVLPGFIIGWALTGLAFAGDNWGLAGARLPPYGFWVVFVLHASFGLCALIYFIYATVSLRRSESQRQDDGEVGPRG